MDVGICCVELCDTHALHKKVLKRETLVRKQEMRESESTDDDNTFLYFAFHFYLIAVARQLFF